jgi:ABC-2 type transport system ATP-binding protein
MRGAIETEALTKSFGPLIAVDSLTLRVAWGEIFGLVGPDGAGKTTTMRLLSAILEPTSGDAWVAGHHIVKAPDAIRKEIGYMSQRLGLYPDLTVMENIEFYADLCGVPARERDERIESLLGFGNLGPFKRRLGGRLSGGMRQKLALLCTLIHKPRILFLDEPTNGVDPVSRRDFWRMIERLPGEGVAVFVSTSYLDEAERFHRLALLHRGRILSIGTPDELKRLMRGVTMEIRSPEPWKVSSLLKRKLSGSVSPFGDRVHLVTEDPDGDLARAAVIMRNAGLDPGEIQRIEPTLEDLFLSLLGVEDGH